MVGMKKVMKLLKLVQPGTGGKVHLGHRVPVLQGAHCRLGRKLRHFQVPGAPVMHGPLVTKADFYAACERYFPEHDIVFTLS